MAITTFSELKTAIALFSNRDDLTSVIPDFIALAEADLWRDVRHWRMEKRSTATFDGQYESLPSDFIEIIRIHLQNDRRIELASQAELIEKRKLYDNVTGEPRLYAISAGEIELYPTPDGSYTGEIVYYARWSALSDAATSNWMLTYHPDAYLYGSLVHLAIYLHDQEKLVTWAAAFESAKGRIASDDKSGRWGGTGLRMRRRA